VRSKRIMGQTAPPVHLLQEEFGLSAHFKKDMTVEQAFKTHAGARRVFSKFHLGGCSHCAISETETIEQVSEGYGIPLPMLMDELENLYAQGELTVGDKVRLPDAIRSKLPQLATVPEIGEVKGQEAGAYTVEFGDVRLQGLAEDFLRVEATAVAGA
jgi:hybrid cluster-associated redox disulfide protein